MKNLTKAALIMTIIALSVSPAIAKRHVGEGFSEHGGKRHQNFEMLKVALDLTPQQQEDIREIVTESREGNEALREKMRANRAAIREVMAKEVLDESQLKVLMQEKTTYRTEMMIERHAVRAKIDTLLTPEQQSKHEALRQAKKNSREKKRLAKSHDL